MPRRAGAPFAMPIAGFNQPVLQRNARAEARELPERHGRHAVASVAPWHIGLRFIASERLRPSKPEYRFRGNLVEPVLLPAARAPHPARLPPPRRTRRRRCPSRARTRHPAGVRRTPWEEAARRSSGEQHGIAIVMHCAPPSDPVVLPVPAQRRGQPIGQGYSRLPAQRRQS